MFEVDVDLEAAELVAAWRADHGRLLLPVDRVPRLHGKTVARIRLRGQPTTTAIIGSVVCTYHHGSCHRIQLAPDVGSLSAVKRLHATALGVEAQFAERPPRFLTDVPTLVETGAGEVLMSTTSVSSGGCGLAWEGPRPAVGRPLRLWLGDRVPPADVHAVVCWSAPDERRVSAGLALVHEGATARATWKRFLSEVESSGAPRG
jgi:PilZ domain